MQLIRDESIVVLVGSFNPAIFQPRWLAAEELLSPGLAESAELGVISAGVTSFSAGWLSLEVLQGRLTARTNDAAYFPSLRDLILGILAILEHTPVRKLGLNAHLDFAAPTTTAWHQIGHRLAPKDPWQGLLEKAGTRSVTIEGKRPHSPATYVRVKVEPSSVVHPGVYVDFNEHYELSDGTGSAARAGQVLEKQWDLAQNYFRQTARTLLDGLTRE